MLRRATLVVSTALTAAAGLTPAGGQAVAPPANDSLAPIIAMGQPSRFYAYGGLVGGWGWSDDRRRGVARVMLGVNHDLIQPVVGGFGIAAEGYAGRFGGRADGGVRALATMRVLLLGLGIDQSFAGRGRSFILTITDPHRRGGLIGNGSEIRVDWLRHAEHSAWDFGITMPIGQRWAGRTRPHDTEVKIPGRGLERGTRPLGDDSARIETALARMRRAALAIDNLTTPAFRPNDGSWVRDMRAMVARMDERDADYPNGHTFPIEIDAYHRALTDAFIAAAGSDSAQGITMAAVARRVLLEEVLEPYDSYYARIRSRRVLDAFFARAADSFARALDGESASVGERRAPLVATFARALDIVGAVARAAGDRWGDSRDVWLPLQLALRPEDYDTQEKVDRIVERVVRRDFASGNDVAFLPAEAFSRALRESIRATHSYHVLWIHDFAGVTPGGKTDSVAYRTVLAYLAALTRAASAFDSTRTLPRFMIFLDQWFYSAKGSRTWISLLENPLHHDIELPPSFRGKVRLRASLAALRKAVAGSAALQQEMRTRGQNWLDNVISVRVSITNPSDPSYAGPHLIPKDLRKSLSDNWMRDHRKIVFYDLDERAPGRGAALFTGEGVGQEYENAGWEDRTVIVRGPGILSLKGDAAELLRSQGIGDDQIPVVLRPTSRDSDYAGQVDSLVRDGWIARVLVAQNGTGFLAKHASALKATLYTLMPAGSRIVVPSPFWGSHACASILLGSALRGTHIMMMAPTRANFPGPPYIQLATTRTVMVGLIEMRQLWANQLALVDGRLRTGVFHNTVPTRDVVGRLRELAEHLRLNRFVRDEFPFPQMIFDMLERPDSAFKHLGLSPPPASDTRGAASPKLHLKTQFFASASALRTIMALPQWDTVLSAYAVARVANSRSHSDSLPPALTVNMLAPLAQSIAERSAEEKRGDVLYLVVGSHNEDDLSRVQNGEVLCLVAGPGSLTAVFDFVYLVSSATWIESLDDLERFLPRPDWFSRKMARWQAQVL